MKIMSERRFKEELAKAKEEIYQREQADRRWMGIENQIGEIHRELYYLRCRVDGIADTGETTTEVQE